MRGTPNYDHIPYAQHGIIPAYAGNTFKAYPNRRATRDHPRVCGEHAAAFGTKEINPGSSPRMRGTPYIAGCERADGGIIPAYAGNTARHGGSITPNPGSSPRMRGTRAVCDGESCRIRIIPAYAGNTGLVHVRHSGNGDHPRVCGEHCGVCGAYFSCLGSSPRMRGTPGVDGQWRVAPGIIPAYAGNTCRTRSADSTSRDHPRVCGEHMLEIEAVGEIRGSSPRMRGTRVVADNYGLAVGIIPAYAGNTRA